METAREKALSSLTLAERGFRLPAEWERHAATWIAWPHEQADWPGKFGLIPWVYAEIVRALVRSETVNILVRDSGMQSALPPMSAYFRRVVHLFIRDGKYTDIETESMGEGNYRQVVIKPKA